MRPSDEERAARLVDRVELVPCAPPPHARTEHPELAGPPLRVAWHRCAGQCVCVSSARAFLRRSAGGKKDGCGAAGGAPVRDPSKSSLGCGSSRISTCTHQPRSRRHTTVRGRGSGAAGRPRSERALRERRAHPSLREGPADAAEAPPGVVRGEQVGERAEEDGRDVERARAKGGPAVPHVPCPGARRARARNGRDSVGAEGLPACPEESGGGASQARAHGATGHWSPCAAPRATSSFTATAAAFSRARAHIASEASSAAAASPCLAASTAWRAGPHASSTKLRGRRPWQPRARRAGAQRVSFPHSEHERAGKGGDGAA